MREATRRVPADTRRRSLAALLLATLFLATALTPAAAQTAAHSTANSAEPAAAPPPLLLAETYAGTVGVAQYLVSEKFDGVRAYWDGRRLLTRGGHAIGAPAWFTAVLPDRPLDGGCGSGAGASRRCPVSRGAQRRTTPSGARCATCCSNCPAARATSLSAP